MLTRPTNVVYKFEGYDETKFKPAAQVKLRSDRVVAARIDVGYTPPNRTA